MSQSLENMSIFHFVGFITVFMVARYVLMSGGGYLFFWVLGKDRFAHRKIQKRNPKEGAIRREVLRSIRTFFIFAAIGGVAYEMAIRGHTEVYFEVSEMGWGYYLLSLLILGVIHDAYFYFLHRFLHWKPMFQRVHTVHHESANPSPWAAFAFHPVEAILQGAFVPIVLILLPVHYSAVAVFLVLTTAENVMGHMGYEVWTLKLHKTLGWKVFNTSTHHNLHHELSRSNFGLYFNWWDRWLGTNDPLYEARFRSLGITRRSK